MTVVPCTAQGTSYLVILSKNSYDMLRLFQPPKKDRYRMTHAVVYACIVLLETHNQRLPRYIIN